MQPIEQRWLDLATLPIPQLEDAIVGPGNKFEPATWLLEAAFGHAKIAEMHFLDFGAGLLRNTVGLLTMSPQWRASAYDSHDMLIRGQSYYVGLMPFIAGRLRLTSNWNVIKIRRYNAVIATLVLQHMSVAAVREALSDFAEVSDVLVVCGRDTFDEETNLTVDEVVKEQWNWIRGWGSTGTIEHHSWGYYTKK